MIGRHNQVHDGVGIYHSIPVSPSGTISAYSGALDVGIEADKLTYRYEADSVRK
jgi:hypothetical protein